MTWFRCGMKNNEYKVLDTIMDHTIRTFKANYTSIKAYLFQGCNLLTDVNIPEVTTISTYAFYTCSSLAFIDLPKTNTIADHAFNRCTSLATMVLRSDVKCSISSTTVLANTPFTDDVTTAVLYVPQSLISTYESDSNWSQILAHTNTTIQAIEGSPYEEV